MPRSPFRDLPREVAALTAVSFSVAVGFGVVAPVIPLFARSFGVDKASVGAVLSAFALMRFVSALVAGRLVDRLGERTMLSVGIGVVAASSALAGLSQSYPQLLVLRGVGGVGSAMFSISAMSLLLRTVHASQRGRAVGLFQGGFLVGGISGPAIGGVLATVSIRAPFFVYAATLAVAGAIGLFLLRAPGAPESADAASAQKAGRTTLATALRTPAYRAALLANLGQNWAAVGVRSSLIPLFVVESLHRDSVWVGVGFVIVAAINGLALLPAGRMVDTRGRRPILITGSLVSAVAMVSLIAAPNLIGYLVAMVLLGVGSGMLNVAPAAIVGDVAGGRGGSVVAGYQMAGDAGSIGGPLIAGALADQVSYEAAFVVTAGVLVLAAATAAFTGETRRPSEAAIATTATAAASD